MKGSSIPDLLTVSPDGQAVTVSSDNEKASVLNKFFVLQIRLQNVPSAFPDLSSVYPDAAVADPIQTTPSEVFDCLSHLKPGKAPG